MGNRGARMAIRPQHPTVKVEISVLRNIQPFIFSSKLRDLTMIKSLGELRSDVSGQSW